MKLITKLAKSQYAFDKDNETHLLVQLEAPKVEWDKKRSPICIVPVLDVSSSMSGAKLDYVKKACRKLIDNLAPDDLMGIVAFDSNVHEIAPVCEITEDYKQQLKNKVGDLRAGSCTNMAGGLALALNRVNDMDLSSNMVIRVVLFTDGHANVGVSGRRMLDFLKETRGKTSVSCFGFGVDCDQELLADMANQGEGNYAYIDSPDAAMTAFARELGGLMSTYAQNIEVTISSDKHNEVVEILNDENVEDKDGLAVITLRDILGEETKSIVAKVKLGEVEKHLPRKVNAFKVSVRFTDKEGKDQILDSQTVKVKFCKPEHEPKEEDADVMLFRDRLLAAKAQDIAEEFARVGQFDQAQAVLYACSAACGDEKTSGFIHDLASQNYTVASYNTTLGDTNTARSLFRGRRVSNIGGTAKKYRSMSQTNAAMDSLEADFKSDDEPVKKEQIVDISSLFTATKPEEEKSNKSTAKKRSGQDW